MGDLWELEFYPYSGHSVLMGKEKRFWQDRDYVLGYFGKKKRESRERYAEFVSKGIGRRNHFSGDGE